MAGPTYNFASGGVWRLLGTASEAGPVQTAPSAPSVLGVTPGDGSVSLSWQAPANNGGSPITGYRIELDPGGASLSVSGSTLSGTVSGLTNDTDYTLTIVAINAIGESPPSPSSAVFTPQAVSGSIVRRNATNTGPLGVFDATLGRKLQYSDLTAYTGPTTITTPGTTVYRKDIGNGLIIAADNVTIDQCRISGSGSGTYVFRWSGDTPPVGFTIRDTEIDGKGVPGTEGVYPSGNGMSSPVTYGWGYTLLRCNIHSFVDLGKPQNNPAGHPIMIDSCYLHTPIHVLGDAPDDSKNSHNDGLHMAGTGSAGGWTVKKTTIDLYTPEQTGSYASGVTQFGSYGTGVATGPIIIEDNYFNGAGYGLRMGATGLPSINGVVRRNRFGLNWKYGPWYKPGMKADDGSQLQWENTNVWDVTGTTDYGLSVIEGGVIS